MRRAGTEYTTVRSQDVEFSFRPVRTVYYATNLKTQEKHRCVSLASLMRRVQEPEHEVKKALDLHRRDPNCVYKVGGVNGGAKYCISEEQEPVTKKGTSFQRKADFEAVNWYARCYNCQLGRKPQEMNPTQVPVKFFRCFKLMGSVFENVTAFEKCVSKALPAPAVIHSSNVSAAERESLEKQNVAAKLRKLVNARHKHMISKLVAFVGSEPWTSDDAKHLVEVFDAALVKTFNNEYMYPLFPHIITPKILDTMLELAQKGPAYRKLIAQDENTIKQIGVYLCNAYSRRLQKGKTPQERAANKYTITPTHILQSKAYYNQAGHSAEAREFRTKILDKYYAILTKELAKAAEKAKRSRQPKRQGPGFLPMMETKLQDLKGEADALSNQRTMAQLTVPSW